MNNPVVYKYVLRPYGLTSMPKGAKPIAVGEQDHGIALWALVDVNQPTVDRKIHICPTGVFMPGDPGEHVGTVQMSDGLVFHIFDGGEYSASGEGTE